MRIGLISDTHGLLPEPACALLAGVDQIIHAGDIGDLRIIRRLEQIAPVAAITGNVDWGGPLDGIFPHSQMLGLAGRRVYVTHIGGKPREFFAQLPEPLPHVAICGHSHSALVETHRGVLFVNPGSAGQGRFGGGLSVAVLTLDEQELRAEILPFQLK